MTDNNAQSTANESAFPIPRQVSGKGEDYWETNEKPGLTKREYFAAMAMQGLLSNSEEMGRNYKNSKIGKISQSQTVAEFIAICSVKMADEILKQLEK